MSKNRLHKLEIQNIQAIKDIVYEFDPETNSIIVCGDNGAGKSSLMKAIAWCFCGKNIYPDTPIRDGEKEGHAECVTDDYVVRLRFYYNKHGILTSNLTVIPRNGGKEILSPQSRLNAMLTNKTIDPISLLDKHPLELRDILVNLVDLGIDLDAHEKLKQQLYDDRTVAGREVVRKKSMVDEIPLPPNWQQLPPEKISAAALNQEYQAAVQHNSANQHIRNGLDAARRILADRQSQYESAQAAINKSIERKNNTIKVFADAAKRIGILKTDADKMIRANTREIREKISALERDLALAIENNKTIDQAYQLIENEKDKLGILESNRVTAEKAVDSAKALLSKAADNLSYAENDVASMEKDVSELKDMDVEEISAQIAQVEETNEKISQIKMHFRAEKEWEAAKAVVDDYTAKIEQKDWEKDKAIAAAKFPVKGLSVDSKGMIFRGRRFEQASTAEKLDILVAIHFALNPNGRFIILNDAATLDKKTMAHLIEKAEQEDFQIIFERIDTDEQFEKTSKLVICDGELV